MKNYRRQVESIIAWYTAASLVVYIPVETISSLPNGLLSPFYLIDVIAIGLLIYGTFVSLRQRPVTAPEILCIAYAWTSANAWRATFDRVDKLDQGLTLPYGMLEMWFVAITTAASLIVFVTLFVLVIKKHSHKNIE